MWNRSCSVVNHRKTELSFAHACFLLRHYAHVRTDRAGIPDRVPTAPLKKQAKFNKFVQEMKVVTITLEPVPAESCQQTSTTEM